MCKNCYFLHPVCVIPFVYTLRCSLIELDRVYIRKSQFVTINFFIPVEAFLPSWWLFVFFFFKFPINEFLYYYFTISIELMILLIISNV